MYKSLIASLIAVSTLCGCKDEPAPPAPPAPPKTVPPQTQPAPETQRAPATRAGPDTRRAPTSAPASMPTSRDVPSTPTTEREVPPGDPAGAGIREVAVKVLKALVDGKLDDAKAGFASDDLGAQAFFDDTAAALKASARLHAALEKKFGEVPRFGDDPIRDAKMRLELLPGSTIMMDGDRVYTYPTAGFFMGFEWKKQGGEWKVSSLTSAKDEDLKKLRHRMKTAVTELPKIAADVESGKLASVDAVNKAYAEFEKKLRPY